MTMPANSNPMVPRGSFALLVGVCSAALLGSLACNKQSEQEQAAAKASATAAIIASGMRNASASPFRKPKPQDEARERRFPIPTGPALGILPGKGVGPIRLGATVATIERHMQKPCDVKTESVCRYIGRAVEFELDDKGVTKAIVVHRRDRDAGKGPDGKARTYGIFRGAIQPDLQLGMLMTVMLEELGKPKSITKVEAPNPDQTLERHAYPGMILEYDRLPNGKVVLGGVRIEAE